MMSVQAAQYQLRIVRPAQGGYISMVMLVLHLALHFLDLILKEYVSTAVTHVGKD